MVDRSGAGPAIGLRAGAACCRLGQLGRVAARPFGQGCPVSAQAWSASA